MEIIKLKNYIGILKRNNELHIGYRKIFKIIFDEEIFKFLLNLKYKGFEKEIFQSFLKNSKIKEVIKKLALLSMLTIDNSFIYKDTILENTYFYFEQFKDNPINYISKIKNVNILILGLGAIGANVLNSLVRSGFRNFVLVDFDVVTISNLNRQNLYDSDDIGYKKTIICTKKIKKFFKDINIKYYDIKINSKRDISHILKQERIDLFLQASDTPYFINKICFESSKVFNVPIFLRGVGIDLGIFSLVSDFDKTSLDKNFYLNKDKPLKASIEMTSNIISSFISLEILKFFMLDNNRYNFVKIFDFNTMKFS